jgi:alpha-glucosidase (family GH31 glycosyl hydrolase)
MNPRHVIRCVAVALAAVLLASCATKKPVAPTAYVAASASKLPKLDGFFYETRKGRVKLPVSLTEKFAVGATTSATVTMPDGRVVTAALMRDGKNFTVSLTAAPNADILKWGLAVDAADNEYFTGLMERVVDGPQQWSWARGIREAMNLRGQQVEMIVKPTTSVYSPFYISSRGYGVFVLGDWPGWFDFCVRDHDRVRIQFEGPAFRAKFYTDAKPVEIVQAHALDAGPPVLPPKWMYGPWRWRDENTQRTNYYDGTRVTGPFNSEFMEDMLMMKHYGIPCAIYWVDRPWGRGKNGCDDFEIDPKRLPHFNESVKWLEEQNTKMVLWIAPFLQGAMKTNGLAHGYNLAAQKPQKNNYPMVDLTNPKAKKFWQDGLAKFLKIGVAGFKLDRGEENIPEGVGPEKVFDGRSIRENRNAYPPMYVQAAYEVGKEYRGDDFFMMPRGAYTGSSQYGVFWGGDIGGTQEGLRASIISAQRSAVMGYPNWGSDTCGYNDQKMETEVCERWLEFSCFTPIMEVGPTKNVAFWNFHKPARYDDTLIAAWRFYAQLHTRLADYSYAQGKVAHDTGLPIIRPLFLAEPTKPDAWANWWTYLYGPDIVVSPVWKKQQHTQDVYLPAGSSWRDAWNPGHVFEGGRSVSVITPPHLIPIFVRVGSGIELGDLNQQWTDAQAAAKIKPDLKKLDAEVKTWFEQRK